MARAGEPGGYVGDAGLAGVGVDGHGHESVDQRDRVSARFLRDVGHLRDAGHVGRQLDDQRPAGGALRGGNDLVEGARIAAELQPALGGVGAGNVEFVGGDAFAVVENLDGSLVVVAGVAEDIGENHDVLDLLESGQLFREKRGCADVLQADGVKHAGRGLPEARRRIARHGLAGQTFDHESTQLIEVNYIFEFDSVAEGSAGRNDGVLEWNARDGHTQIERLAAVSGGGGHCGAPSLGDRSEFPA